MRIKFTPAFFLATGDLEPCFLATGVRSSLVSTALVVPFSGKVWGRVLSKLPVVPKSEPGFGALLGLTRMFFGCLPRIAPKSMKDVGRRAPWAEHGHTANRTGTPIRTPLKTMCPSCSY